MQAMEHMMRLSFALSAVTLALAPTSFATWLLELRSGYRCCILQCPALASYLGIESQSLPSEWAEDQSDEFQFLSSESEAYARPEAIACRPPIDHQLRSGRWSPSFLSPLRCLDPAWTSETLDE